MRQDLHLFIGDKEVEFNSDPKILFNFKETELHNPTIVKNSWTKTININSTPANDDIFNHYWNLERTQSGVHFNAMIKNPFTLYINNILIQNGYCKLDSIKMSNHSIQYQISLFGGLGDFFYNLSYWDGNESDNKKSLASLNYADGYLDVWGDDPNLDFTINKEAVKDAWDAIMGTGTVIPDDKWSVINFAPVYNGIPADFDANKAIVNNIGLDASYFKNKASGDTNTEDYYQPMINGTPNLSGYTLAELKEDLTADETFDYRSYLNRPVVNVYRTIIACCNPENNGGYQVKLDSHFFHKENPYYYGNYAWMTLPMLRDLEVDGGAQTERISNASITNIDRNKNIVNYNTSTLSAINNVRLKINVGLDASSTTASTLYSYYDYKSTHASVNPLHIKYVTFNVGATFQLFARDSSGKICAQSNAYCLSTNQYSPDDKKNVWADFSVSGYPKPKYVIYKQGKWVKRNNKWIFCDMQGNQVDIEFTFPTSSPISSIEIITQINGGARATRKGRWIPGKSTYPYSFDDYPAMVMWDKTQYTDSRNKTAEEIMASAVNATFVYRITEFYGEASDYEALFSNTYISKEKLLSTSFTPADFLISYCKLFGLYFYRDPAEISDNPLIFPKGVIHIMDRDTFFTGEYVDLHTRIDRSRDMTISPTLAGSKWYAFDLEQIDSDAQKAYKSTYGQNYGRQVVNTGYNFDNNTTNLYEGNVFKGGIMVREKDKYFCGNYRRNPRYAGVSPNFALNGFKNTLYHATSGEPETYEYEVNPIGFKGGIINDIDLKSYDAIPKLQCHGDNNDAADGDGVLLFYNGFIETKRPYWITDDIIEMQTLNGGNACWIMTVSENNGNGNQIAIRIPYFPVFTRDFFNGTKQEGIITHSWNFGHPQVIFSPNTFTSEGDSIYDRCWKNYINDMYSVDGRKLTCYVNLQGIPTNAWLRRWYWFDNSIWRLNEIKDYNAADPATTQCEFIKVQDVDNYKLDEITPAGLESLTLSKYTVDRTGETITGIVYLQAGGDWFSTDSSGVITGYDEDGNKYTSQGALRPYTGNGVTSNITVTFPPSTAQTPITWNVCVEDGLDNRICKAVIQEGDNTSYIRFANVYQEMGPRGGILETYYTDKRIDQDTITVNVEATGASSDPSWLTATLDKVGKRVTLSASTYTGPLTNRGARVTISGVGEDSNTYSSSMTVVQMSSSISISPTTLTFDYYADSSTANTKTIDIGSSEPITITLEDQQ